MKKASILEVLLIDPCLSDRGISNTTIPLSVGFIGSYLKSQISDVNITVLKTSEDILSFINKKKPDVLGICNYLWNTNVANRLSRYAREINPKIFIIFGGPEVNKNPIDKNIFFKKYSQADMLVEREGEIAFTKLIKIYLEEGRDVKKVRSRIKDLGNCFYISKEKQIVAGPEIPRVDMHILPSPYLAGLFDHFLKEGSYVPLIQTNRGCPYACTFCNEGMSYYNKINYRSVDYIKQELDYIAERVDPTVGLHIADSNWGMYKQDIEISRHIKKLKDKYNWPMHIFCSTGKSQLPRILNVSEILDGALRITNAVQSLNNDVLDEVKRKNASNLQEYLKGLEMVSEPEIILPLPKETLKTFISGLNNLLDTNAPIRFTVYPGLLLSNTAMSEKEQIKKHGLKIKYRQHQNLTGWVADELVCETECNIYSTSYMNEKEVMQARKYVVLMDALLRQEPIKEIFYYLDSKGINRSLFTMSLYENINSAPKEIQKCFEQYVNAITSECFDTEEQVFDYMAKHSESYTYGHKGGDLLRYSQKLWIDHFDDMFRWIFLHLNNIFAEIHGAKEELNSLHQFLISLYYDQSQLSSSKLMFEKKFDYDILQWMQEAPKKQLNEFKKEVTYSFKETKFSKLPKNTIWKSFGFNLSKNDRYNFQHFSRLWLSRIQRHILRNDGFPVKQRFPQMATFAEKVGL